MSTILPVPYQSAYIICSFTENDIYAGNAISIISPKTMFAVMKRIPPVSTPAVTFVAQYFAFCDLMSKNLSCRCAVPRKALRYIQMTLKAAV